MFPELLANGAGDQRVRISELKVSFGTGKLRAGKRAWLAQATRLVRDRTMLMTYLGVLGSGPGTSLNFLSWVPTPQILLSLLNTWWGFWGPLPSMNL